MCGITGLLHFGRIGDADIRIRAMADSIAHRGPDDSGYRIEQDIALGFRRLAIVDVEGGHQPMCNEDGSIWIIFNGEIYNHVALRHELEGRGHRFASDHSDTETLVHGYEEWGEDFVTRLNGMFAFAIWDSRRRRLLLGRDRLGIKPLYLADLADGGMAFGSEIRTIHASGLVAREADPQAIFAYFQQQNLWRGRSMFRSVRQLPAGHILTVSPESRHERRFWDIRFNRQIKDPREAAESLRHAVEGAITRQMAADVPVMSYLSGGIDSSAIVAGAHRIDPAIRAYSCIFNLDSVGEDRFVDEREFSRAMAAHLRIDHVELELQPAALIGALRGTIEALEEPRMGMAYVNYLIAGRVAQDSKVVLSGCGGDEMLGGYVGRYAYVAPDRGKTAPATSPLWRRMLARLGRGQTRPAPADTADMRMLRLLAFPVGQTELDAAFTSDFRARAGEHGLEDEMKAVLRACPSEDEWDRLLYLDAHTYLSGLLMVEDKLSMAHGLEARVPLLDNEVIDIAMTFDWSLLCNGTSGKIAFRNAIRDWVPPMIADKPKMGFGPPDASWYRGALQPFIRKVLATDRIRARGVLEPAYVERAIDAHMSGAASHLPLIWSLLSFEAWCEIFDVCGGDLGAPVLGP